MPTEVDVLACEPHFLDHVAPIVRALPNLGRLVVDDVLVGARADRLGLEADLISAPEVRRLDRYPIPRLDEDGPAALVASYGDLKVGRRLGYRRFAFLEHGAGQAYTGDRKHRQHGSYAGGVDREDVGLFLCPNAYSADLWRRSYPDAIVEEVGSPKVDGLPAREPGPPTVALSFHWDMHAIAETRSAYGHYKPVLAELVRRFRVIGHGHPRAAYWLEKVYRRLGVEWVPDFDDVCRRSDVYVCDNSSTLFEYAATGRPVVVLNAPWYRRNVSHGLRFWDASTIGRNVSEPGELAGAIAAALEDPSSDAEARDAALRIAYTYRGDATARAVDALVRWSEGLDAGEGEALGEGRPPARGAA